MQALVENGADLEAREAGGWTALCHAEADDDVAIVEYLQTALSLKPRIAVNS